MGHKDPVLAITNKDVRKAVQLARRNGCEVERTKGGHVKITSPNGDLYFVGTTQPAARTVHNMRAALARSGVTV